MRHNTGLPARACRLAGSSGAWARAQNPQVNDMKMHFILLNRYFLVESSLP